MVDRSITYTLAARVGAYISPMAEAAAVTELLETKQRQLTAAVTTGSAAQTAAAGGAGRAVSAAATSQSSAMTRAATSAQQAGTAAAAAASSSAQAASALNSASQTMVAARQRETAATSAVTAAEERLAALRASGTASGLQLAMAEDNVAQATMRARAAQDQRSISAARLSIADQAATTADAQLAAAQDRASVSGIRQAAGNQRITATAGEATAAVRLQHAATAGLSSANGLLGTSMNPLTAGLGVAALGFGYAAFRGMEFGTAMSEVQTSTGETGAGLEDLRDLAVDLGAQTKYSSEEAAQGVTELSKAGVSSADILGGALAGSLDLAAAGGLDVGQAAEIAATQLTVFNLSGSQASHVADLLAAGAGKAQGSVEDMALALQYAGLPAAGLGLSIEETTGSIALFASNGLIGEKAGTAFRGMLVSMTNPAGKTRELMDDLNLSFFDAQGQFVGMDGVADQLQTRLGGLTQETRNAALAQIFGNEALGAAQILYDSGSSGVDQWTRAVNDAGYAQDYAAGLSDNLRGDIERLGGAFDAGATAVGEFSQGGLRALVQGLTATIEAGGDVVGFIRDLPPELQAAGAAVAVYLVFGAQFLTQLATLRIWANANLFSPLIVGFANLLVPTVTVTGALAAARTALAGFLATAAPFVAVAAIAAGVVSILQADRAATDARESIEGLLAPINGADTNSDRLAAQAEAVDHLRDLAAQAQAELEDYENRSTFEKIWEWGAPDDPGDALREAAENTAAALDEQSEAVDRADQSIEVLARRYGLGRDAVIEFADAHGIDLSGSLQIAQGDFIRLADAAGLTANATSAADAAAGSYGALLAGVGQQAEDSADQLQGWLDMIRDANEGFIDPMNTYTGLLDQKREAERASAQATADATDDQSDSWEDYVQDVSVSLTDYAAKLQEQIDNQRNWQQNLATIAQRGGLDVANALMEMGVQGADVVAQMATANEGEFTTMATTLVEQAQLAASGSNAAMATGLQVMAEIGRQGAAGTVTSIATALGVGVDQVAAIAAQYGVTLAEGVNPVLTSLGRTAIIPAAPRTIGGNALSGRHADGGYISGPGTWTSDSIPAMLSNGEYVIRAASVARYGLSALDALNEGRAAGVAAFAAGGFASTGDVPRPRSTAPYGAPLSTAAAASMQAEYDAAVQFLASQAEAIAGAAGPAGSTAIGGGWQAIWEVVKAAIPQARINSTYRAGDPGYHGRGKAIDFGFGSGPGGAGSAGLASIAAFLYSTRGRTLAELIYDGIGDNTPDVKNGADHIYNAATRAQHANHVHAAVYADGGLVRSAAMQAYEQGTRYVPRTGPAILHEGERVLTREQNREMTTREMTGMQLGRGGTTTINRQRATTVNVSTDADARRIARAVEDAMLDQEFLRG